VKVNPNSLVWCSTDPEQYIDYRRYMTICGEPQQEINQAMAIGFQNLTAVNWDEFYDRRFTQVRVDGMVRCNLYVNVETMKCGYNGTSLRIDPVTVVTLDARSTITGFSLKDSVKGALAQYYSVTPFVIPSERIFIQSFSTGPTASGLNSAMTIPLNNAKEVIVLFPTDANQVSTFRNPQYHHFMVTMLNRNFPQNGCNTNSTEFYRLELESCNLDTILPPTESFENSYLKKVCPAKPIRLRCSEDDTDFLVCFNLERQSSNAFFADPVNSRSETITVTGSSQVQGEGDVYYNIASENHADKINTTCPILCIVSDTFWLFTAGQRATYEIGLSWNECLAKNYPEIYQRLANL
jgi:hypothetical protein